MDEILVPASVVLAIAAGCVAPPPHSVTVGEDVVRGPAPTVVEDVAGLLAAGREAIEASVPGLRETPVEVWIQDDPEAGMFFTPDVEGYDAFVLLRPGARPRIHLPTDGYRECILHELGHALLGPTWDPLPQAVEEGLCDVLNRELADPEELEVRLRCAARAGNSTTYSVSFRIRYPDRKPRILGSFWGNGGGSDSSESELSLAEILALTTLQGVGLTGVELSHVYGVGYLLADRIVASSGIAGLHALCLRARDEGRGVVPESWILSAAGIAGEAEFEQAAREALRADRIELALAHEQFVNLLRKAIAKVPMDATDPARGIDAFLACTEATLTIDGEKVALGELPRFHEWALAHWPEE